MLNRQCVPELRSTIVKVIKSIQIHVLCMPWKRCLPHTKVQVRCRNSFHLITQHSKVTSGPLAVKLKLQREIMGVIGQSKRNVRGGNLSCACGGNIREKLKEEFLSKCSGEMSGECLGTVRISMQGPNSQIGLLS